MMPTRDLFEPSSGDDILRRIRALPASDAFYEDHRRAEDYAQGKMVADVDRELLDRYPETQRGGNRHEAVQPQAIPLTQRYLDESATLYTRPVTYELVDDSGDVVEDATERLKRMLGESSYDAAMHQVERRVLLLGSAGVWYQARAGKLRVVSRGPHQQSGIAPDETTWFHPGDQADYQAMVTQLREPQSDREGEFAYAERAQVAFYQARTRNQPGILDVRPNPHQWPQAYDTDDMRGAKAVLPLQMVTAWHDRAPHEQILPDLDVPIVDLNRELNVQWSMLLDTIAHQGWTQLAASVADPSVPPSFFQAGPRNVMVLGAGEAIQAIDAATNYAGLVDVLQTFVKTVSQSKGLSPQDLSTDQAAAPSSGFAKMLDMLPKIQTRQRFGQRMAAQEAAIAWPRLAAIGLHLGYFAGSVETLAMLRLRVKYADLDVPRSVDEQTKQHEFDIKHGLTTPARILAEREGISVEEAQARIDENKPSAGSPPGDSRQVAEQPGAAIPGQARPRVSGLLGNLIGNRSSREN